jgi:Na+/H+ antiporter NhaD/arsenite permease-like protein
VREAVAVAVFGAAYLLIATEWVHRVVVALAGAGLMLLFGLLDAHDVFNSEEFGIDWEVIFLLFGMMVIVGVLRHTGLFEYLAIWSAKKARGRPFRILVTLLVITAVASALLDNVTTILLVAPVTLLIADRLGAPPVPFLLGEAMVSNIGGAATLIGDPPNIIIGSEAGLSYLEFLANLAPIVAILMLLFLGMIRLMFRRVVRYDPARAAEIMELSEREAITDRPLLVRALGVLTAVTVGFVLHDVLGYDPSIVALLGAGLLVLVARREVETFLREVEWQTLVFFAGLFVMVGALVKVGVVEALADGTLDATGGSVFVAAILLIWLSGALSALVDNIPYVATTAPLVTQLSAALPGDTTVLWWSLALGADLGGNATIIGASANVVVIGIAARSGHRIRFAEWVKYGVPVTLVTLAVSTAYVWFRYFVVG